MQRTATRKSQDRPHAIRPAKLSDVSDVWRLVNDVGLDLNSPYAYAVFAEYFPNTTIVAENESAVIQGFVMGFCPPSRPETAFVWQIGVSASARGHGLAGDLLDDLVQRTGARWLEATVTPSNTASDRLFRSTGCRYGASVRTDEVFPDSIFPDAHESEIRYSIGPLR